MSIWYVVICPSRREYFDPGTAREYQMVAAGEQLAALMCRDWRGSPIHVETDWDDDETDTTGWVNRYVAPPAEQGPTIPRAELAAEIDKLKGRLADTEEIMRRTGESMELRCFQYRDEVAALREALNGPALTLAAEVDRLRKLIKRAKVGNHEETASGRGAFCPWCGKDDSGHADDCPAFWPNGMVR